MDGARVRGWRAGRARAMQWGWCNPSIERIPCASCGHQWTLARSPPLTELGDKPGCAAIELWGRFGVGKVEAQLGAQDSEIRIVWLTHASGS